MRVKFGVLEQTQGLHLHTKFHLKVFIVGPYRFTVAKNHNFGQFLIFGGSCTDLLLPMRAKFGVLWQANDMYVSK